MRNLKKFLALVLAMIMVVGSTAMVSADFTDVADSTYEEAINDLTVKGIIKGMTETTFGPKQPVNREQMAIFMARVLTGDVESDDAWKKEAVTPFEDIANFEYQGAIQYAWANSIINGKAPNLYYPADGIKYVEALAMAIRALGLDDGKIEWPWGYYNVAVNLGLTDGITGVQIEQALTREETAQIIYNLIWATPNGEESLASKNFNIQTADNTDLFVITATPKQYHGNDLLEDYTNNDKNITYVGVQALVDGMATGRMYYIPAEDLGIAAEDVEDYFFYSVELINFDEETGKFGAYIMGDAPKTVTNADVAVKDNAMGIADGGVITIGDVDYYTINTTALSELRNNIAIYDANYIDSYYARLITEVDDTTGVPYILNIDGERVARYTSTDSLGIVWYYELATGKNISVEQAIAKYGMTVTNGAMWTTLLDASATDNAYQLKLYDDDRDGLYERAVYVPVYMGVYDIYADGTTNYDALIEELAELDAYDNIVSVKAADVTYSDEAAQVKGAVSVYTYNPQLKEVTVLDIIEPKTGTLQKMESASSGKVIKVTVGGETYQVFFNDDNFANNSSYKDIAFGTLGANIVAKGPELGNWNIANNDVLACLNYYKSHTAAKDITSRIKTGSTVMFYEYNGYVIMIDEIDNGILDDIAVIETPREFYYDGVYYDIITNGERVESAHITVLDGRDISRYTTYDFLFAAFLADANYHNPGSIYFSNYGVLEGESYEFDIFMDTYAEFVASYNGDGTPLFVDARKLANDAVLSDSDTTDADITPDTMTDADGNAVATGTLSFNANGIHTNDASGEMIRTDAETIWYFIDTDEDNAMNTKVDIHVGAAINETIEFNLNSWIWVDKTTTRGAAADLIIVKDAVSTGIHTATAGNSIIFARGINSNNYVTGTAKEFGFIDNTGDYKGTYYKYADISTLNIDNGTYENRPLYSKEPLVNDSILEINEQGIVVANHGKYNSSKLMTFSVKALYQTQKYNIQSVAGGSNNFTIDMTDVTMYLNGKVLNNYYYQAGTTTAIGQVDEEYESLAGIDSYLDLDKTADVVTGARFTSDGKFEATIHKAGGKTDVITADDDITNVIAMTYECVRYEGEAAIKQLNSALRVFYMAFDNRTDNGDDKALEDHTIVFILEPTAATTAGKYAFEQLPENKYTQYIYEWTETEVDGETVDVLTPVLNASDAHTYKNTIWTSNDWDPATIAADKATVDAQTAFNTSVTEAVEEAGGDWTAEAVQDILQDADNAKYIVIQ